jgi:hypothetical protein
VRSRRGRILRVTKIANQNKQKKENALGEADKQKQSKISVATREKPGSDEEQDQDQSRVEPTNASYVSLLIGINRTGACEEVQRKAERRREEKAQNGELRIHRWCLHTRHIDGLARLVQLAVGALARERVATGSVWDLKLIRDPAHSSLPLTAFPSMSLIPCAPFHGK